MQHSAFPTEPWAVRETELDLDYLAETESMFALSNGHIGLRGNLDEGEPHGMPGTYLGGFWESRPLPYAEAGYGDPEQGQQVVNVTNGKVMRLLVEDSPLDLRYGRLHGHERVLDLRNGVLTRDLHWTSASHQSVKVRSTRLVSLTQRAIAAIEYVVEPVDSPLHVVLQSELIANEALPDGGEKDPRAGGAHGDPLISEMHRPLELGAVLVHRTAKSGLHVVAAMRHEIDGPDGTETMFEDGEDGARLSIAASLQIGQSLRVIKYIAYGWSRVRSVEALRDQATAALYEATMTGWEGLQKGQREALDDFWSRADVEIEGDPELQQATRFALFHVLQSGARAEQRAIPAKGLTGSGYDGHTFWDSEAFVLPVLTYTYPRAAGDALRWRHRTMDRAKDRARQLELRGAAFPWRTIHGEECSGYWPAGTGAFHINADIAAAVIRYTNAVDDPDFEREVGLELLVETARLWHSLGHHDSASRFRIDGVTGPDEYSAVADNNVYTNLMAQLNLRAAADAAERHEDLAKEFEVDEEEIAGWRDAAETMLIPYDSERGVHPQAERFTEHQIWDFQHTDPDDYPLLLHYPYFDLYRKQVVKQADLVLAMHLRDDAFTDEQKLANFDYYEPLTVRDSSLSASTQAIIAAEVGHLDLAYHYHREAALMDLDNLEHNVGNGLHIASLAGAWSVAVSGFGGMRERGRTLHFKPRLPEQLTRLRFRLCHRGGTFSVEIGPDTVTYRRHTGEVSEIFHYGKPVSWSEKGEVTLEIPAFRKPPKTPHQPPGREPRRPER